MGVLIGLSIAIKLMLEYLSQQEQQEVSVHLEHLLIY